MRPLNRSHTKVSEEKAANVDAAMDSLARLLTSRERSVKEVRTRLMSKGYAEATVSRALERALGCGLLDDERFAQGFIKDKIARGWGRRRIEQELALFGVDLEMLVGYPDEFFSDDDQIESALQALKKHHSRSKNPRQAAFRYLAGKGYSPDIISQALKRAD